MLLSCCVFPCWAAVAVSDLYYSLQCASTQEPHQYDKLQAAAVR
jgi:hypothetical protein